ncbi:winged helix-turn-helix transcriptional regulator [bacterium]|nr:winged helix-turn-helix transcriptional regulator [bacterium]
MQKNELNTLLELKQNPSLTQRSLAHRLNISLGLTNAILQNLIHRGWIKAKRMTGRKILYLITPQGMARATNLIYDRFRETQNYYQYTKELLTSYLIDLYNQGKRKAIIYGTNQLAEITYLSLLNSPLKLHSILSDDPSKKKFLGRQVFTISDFTEKYSKHLSQTSQKDVVILSTISPEKMHQEIKKYKSIPNNFLVINLENVLKNYKNYPKSKSTAIKFASSTTSNIASRTTTSSTPKPTTENNKKIFNNQNQIRNIFAKEKTILLAYLFGSQAAQAAQARAKTSPLSDYDFAVLLSQKPPFPFKYELKNKLVNTLNTKNTKQVDLIILNDVPLELKYKVIATGKIIYQKNPTTKIEFEADTLSRYFDYLPILRTQKEDILKSKGEKDGDR